MQDNGNGKPMTDFFIKKKSERRETKLKHYIELAANPENCFLRRRDLQVYLEISQLTVSFVRLGLRFSRKKACNLTKSFYKIFKLCKFAEENVIEPLVQHRTESCKWNASVRRLATKLAGLGPLGLT